MAATDQDLARLIVQFSADFTRYRNETQKIVRATYGAADKVERRFTGMERRVSRTGDAMGRQFRMAIAALGTGFAVRDLGRLADAWTEQENALKSVAAAVDRPVSSMEQLVDVALSTRSALSSTVALYSRTERAAENLGRSQAQLRRFVELTNMAFVAGGATGTERRSAVIQLAQGLASEQLMGEELRSIRENAPLVARAIADAMGVGIGALRDLGSEGKITSEVVLNAVLSAGQSIEAQFDATTATVGQSIENLRTRMSAYIARVDDATNASQTMAGFIDYVSRNLNALAEAAIVSATAIGGVLAGRALAAAIPSMITFAAATTGASGALARATLLSLGAARGMAALRASMMFLVTNPIGLLIMGIASAVGYLALETQSAASRAERLQRALSILGEETDAYGNSTAAAAAAQQALMEARRLDNLEIVRTSLVEQRNELQRNEAEFESLTRIVERYDRTGQQSSQVIEGYRRRIAELSDEIESGQRSVSVLTEGVEGLTEATVQHAAAQRESLDIAGLATRSNEDLEDILKMVTDTLGDASDAQRMLNDLQRDEAVTEATSSLERQERALRQVETAINAIRAAAAATSMVPFSDDLAGESGFYALSGDVQAEVNALETEADRYRSVIELLQGFIAELNDGTNVGANRDARSAREQRMRREADAIRDRIDAEHQFARALGQTSAEMSRGSFEGFLTLLQETTDAQQDAASAIATLNAQRAAGVLTEAEYNEQIERANANMQMLSSHVDQLNRAADSNEAAKALNEQVDAQERLNRLVSTQLDHSLELARLRGNDDQIRALEREVRVRERIAELQELGLSKDEAGNTASREADEIERARTAGREREQFASVFSDTLRALFSGDIKNVLSNAFGTAADEAFRRLGESVYDAFFSVPADIAKASAEGAAQGSAAAAPMATAITSSGAVAGGAMQASIVTAGIIAAKTMASAIRTAAATSGGGSGGVASVVSAFAGFFADGGNMSAGQWGYVGEEGIEKVRALPGGGLSVEPMRVKGGAAMAASRGGGSSTVNFKQTIDLTGANGERTIRQIAYQAAAEGAQAAVRAVEERSEDRFRMSTSGG